MGEGQHWVLLKIVVGVVNNADIYEPRAMA